MDYHLRIMERNMALAERVAYAETNGWQRTSTTHRPVRSYLATILISLAARLDSTPVSTHQEGGELARVAQA